MVLTRLAFAVIFAVALQLEIACADETANLVTQEFITEFNEIKKTVQAQTEELGHLRDRVKQLETSQRDTDDVTHAEVDGDGRVMGPGTRFSRFVVDNEVSSVAFCAYLDHRNLNLGPDQPIVFNKVLLNAGEAYNNISGMFTAPFSGIYIFSFSVTCTRFTGEPAEEIRVKLVVNNTHQLTAIAQSNIEYDDNQGGNTAILHVNQGDVVWIGHHSGIGDNLFSNDDLRVTSFTGALLSVD